MAPTDPDDDFLHDLPANLADGNRAIAASTLDPAPYEGLTPHAVLDALDAVGLRGDGRILQLNSYENRVFQVGLEEDPADEADPERPRRDPFVVAKFYRAGRWSDAQILEEHAFALELAAEDIPAVAPLILDAAAVNGQVGAQLSGNPPTLAHVGPWRFAAAPRCAGRDPELENPAALRWVGRFLARMHLVGQRKAYEHRAATFGTHLARQSAIWLADQDLLPAASAASWQRAANTALEAADAAFARCADVQILRVHGDMHRGNLLWRPPSDSEPGGPHFVDLDDTSMGPAVQDLWMLLGGDPTDASAQLRELLAGYESIRPFDRRELGLIEALRTVRLVQHSAWIARRWSDPAFPVAFPGFESPAWWSQQTGQLLEQVEAIESAPLQA